MPIHDRTNNSQVVLRNGVFTKQLPFWHAVALIVSGTIGAGVLGIPYAISKLGVIPGMMAIFSVGILLMSINLLVGWVSMQAKKPLQVIGLAETYLGLPGKWLATIVFFGMMFGVQVIYLIGVSEILHTLLPWSQLGYAGIFFVLTSIVCWRGMKTVKSIELLLTLAILAVVFFIIAVSAPHVSYDSFVHIEWINVLVPYGVLLFAFQGATTVPEAYSVIKDRAKSFPAAIITSYIIIIAIYMLFTMFVVGVTGQETTQIATIGLGNAIGPWMIVVGNVFALLTMSTSYILVSQSLRDALTWDAKWKHPWSTLTSLCVPLVLFLVSPKEFVFVIDVVGGVFAGTLLLLMVMTYGVARTRHTDGRLFQFFLWGALVPIFFFLLVGVIVSLPILR